VLQEMVTNLALGLMMRSMLEGHPGPEANSSVPG